MSEAKPLIWLLHGAKAGDNAQVSHLASLLPGEKVVHKLIFNRLHVLPNMLLGAGVASLTEGARANFKPPWPDLVIAAGKRSAPVARWIKAQSQGASRLVHIGRPRAPLADFDLVITTPQYGLPADANVLELPLPLSGQAAPVPADLERWREAWRELPRPLLAVSIGAQKYPLRFGMEEQDFLARQLNAELAGGGSVLLLASPRTAVDAVPRIASRLSIPHLAYARFDKSNNPYAAALVLCDRIVVTGDSASMLADALRSRKPVSVFSLPVSAARMAWSAKRGLGARLVRAGLLQPPRAMHHLVRHMLVQGIAGEVGHSAGKGLGEDYESAVQERVRALLMLPR